MSRYDEDLYDNPFFMILEQQFTALFDKATANRWIICIPRFATVQKDSLTERDIQEHILKPLAGDQYETVAGSELAITGGEICLQRGFPKIKKVKILFEETFYNNKDESYRVLCIQEFFNKIASDETPSKTGNKSKAPFTYDECCYVLWRNAGSAKTKDHFDKDLTGFCFQYQNLKEENIETLAEMVSGQLTQAMQTVLKDQNIRRSVQQDVAFMNNLKIAVEMYMMNAVHKHLFSAVQLLTKSSDATINKKTRNLVDIRLHQLGVRREFEDNLPGAKKELAMLNQYSTPMGRMLCLKRVFIAISKPLHEHTDIVMTTDDLLPLLIYLIIKSQIPNWFANLMYMKHFQQANVLDKDELSFHLATVEAALNYISSDELRVDSRQFSPQKVSRPSGSQDGQLKRQVSGGSSTTKEKFFQYVQYGDESAVRLMLKRSDEGEDEVSSKLCHPLCDCAKCVEILQQVKQNSNKFSINARDDIGRIALHKAAFFGQASLIDILVKNGSLTDATDFMGFTPLHLACQKGFQNIILLLVHFGADISSQDNEGNTPLHLCAKNGHEDCVKAILFLDILKNKLNVNAKNDMGDTPLHLAAKWGYEGIVRFLLESEANPMMRNRKKQTPLDVAQNPSIKQQLQAATDEPMPVMVPYGFSDPPPVTPTKPAPSHTSHIVNRRSSQNSPEVTVISPTDQSSPPGYVFIESRNSFKSSVALTDNSRNSFKSSVALTDNSSKAMMAPTSTPVTSLDSVYLGQLEKLYKAIADKDLPLMKFYLGFSDSEDSDDDDDESPCLPEDKTLCHPLCQCRKCRPKQKVHERTSLTVDCQNKKGFAPLHISVIEKNMDAFKLLLRRGAQVNMKTAKNVTALHLACYYSNLEMAKLLLKFGADVNAVDLYGEIPLHLACSKQNSQLVQFLIQSSSEVNKANVKGNTPLHIATSHNAVGAVRVLLHNKGDPNLTNKEGQIPYHLTKSLEIQKLLLKKQEELKSASCHELSTDPEIPESHDVDSIGNVKPTDNKLLSDIASFDKSKSLKRSKTFDHSTALLNSQELKLSLSIKSFDKTMCLRHSKTFDSSQSSLLNMKRNIAIENFDSLKLRHVDSVDKSGPLHLYYLAQSCYINYADEIQSDPERHEKSETQNDDDLTDSTEIPESSSFDKPSPEDGCINSKDVLESSVICDDGKSENTDTFKVPINDVVGTEVPVNDVVTTEDSSSDMLKGNPKGGIDHNNTSEVLVNSAEQLSDNLDVIEVNDIEKPATNTDICQMDQKSVTGSA